MTAKITLINEAFSYIGLLPEETGLQAAEIQRGARELDKLIARWSDDGVTLPFNYTDDPADESGLALGDEGSVTASLAVILKAIYVNSRPLDDAIIALSRSAKHTLKAKYSVQPAPQYAPTLPTGSANNCYPGRTRQFFHNPNANNVIGSNNDPILDDDGTPLEAE
jgi:hypothetical protein